MQKKSIKFWNLELTLRPWNKSYSFELEPIEQCFIKTQEENVTINRSARPEYKPQWLEVREREIRTEKVKV